MAYKQKEYREKMKRDGSGMEKKKYILLDVGGTEIKGSVSDRNGVRTKIRKFPARAQKSTEKILDNFAKRFPDCGQVSGYVRETPCSRAYVLNMFSGVS